MRDSRGGLDLVEVERDVPWHGAVEPGLGKRSPLVAELVRAALVVLAHPGNAGVDDLEEILCLILKETDFSKGFMSAWEKEEAPGV